MPTSWSLGKQQSMGYRNDHHTRRSFSGSIFILEVALMVMAILVQDSNSHVEAQNIDSDSECRLYLAPSSIPNGGLGVFTTSHIPRGGQIGSNAGMCIQVDIPDGAHQLTSHTHGRNSWFWGTEGVARQFCPGVATIFNTQMEKSNTLLTSVAEPSHGSLSRQKSPGAGAITPFHGIQKFATKDIPAGCEITYDYGDWNLPDEESNVEKKSMPHRSLKFLREYGMCMDNIVVKPSTIEHAGRGAFASRMMAKGSLVAPAPLLVLPDIRKFNKNEIILNYVFQPEGFEFLLAPYGEGVNYINHASRNRQANVGLRWSSSKFHHSEFVKRISSENYDSFVDEVWAGALIIEYYALRTIHEGEEIFLDYGSQWEEAWNMHVSDWVPNNEYYVYPSDVDNTEELLTVSEQEENPYAPNLATVCLNAFWEYDPFLYEYEEPQDYDCSRKRDSCYCWCHVTEKNFDEEEEEYLYTVVLNCGEDAGEYTDASIVLQMAEQQSLTRVPRHSIRFESKPYWNDQFLEHAFRHPIGFPKHLLAPVM